MNSTLIQFGDNIKVERGGTTEDTQAQCWHPEGWRNTSSGTSYISTRIKPSAAPGQEALGQAHRLRGLPVWEQPCGKEPGSLDRYKLSISQHCALAAETADTLGVNHRGTGWASKARFLALYLALMRSHLNTVSSLSSKEKYYTKRT